MTILTGSTGAREYTAVWEKIPDGKPKPGESGDGDHDKKEESENGSEAVDSAPPAASAKQTEKDVTDVSVTERRAEMVGGMGTADIDSLNPQTGNDMAVWYLLAALSVAGLLLLGVLSCSLIKILAYNRDLRENEQELAQVCAAAGIG